MSVGVGWRFGSGGRRWDDCGDFLGVIKLSTPLCGLRQARDGEVVPRLEPVGSDTRLYR